MTDRERWALRGAIQTCRVQRTWYPRRCGADLCEAEEHGDATIVEFRPDGALARRWHHNPDGSESTSTYEYDGAGQLVTVRTESSVNLVELQRYEYDSARRRVRLMVRTETGRDRVAERYLYDATGQMTKTLYVDLAAQRQDTQYSWAFDGSDCSYSAPGAVTLTTLHNWRDQPIEVLFHDGAGRALSRIEFVYDDGGHLLEEAQTLVADLLPPEMLTGMGPGQLEAMRGLLGATVRRQHRYDTRGRRIETCTSLFGPLGQDRKTMAYNEQGDQIEEISEDQQRDFNIDDEGRLSDIPTKETVRHSEARFRYDYDTRGNWVKKTVEGRGGADQDFFVSSTEQRTLVYFD